MGASIPEQSVPTLNGSFLIHPPLVVINGAANLFVALDTWPIPSVKKVWWSCN